MVLAYTFFYFSEQQLVSCSGEEYDTYGCNGGWYDGAWKYIRDNKENGIDTQTSYPYTARVSYLTEMGFSHLIKFNKTITFSNHHQQQAPFFVKIFRLRVHPQ